LKESGINQMKSIEIRQSGPLKGTIRIQGSKNSSLALLAAACLAEQPVTLLGIPDIFDIRVIGEILKDIGVDIQRNITNELRIDPMGIMTGELDHKKTSAYRASYYFIGALLAKQKKVSIGYPGGDDFVSRPIDQHIKLFKALGATVQFFDDYYVVEAGQLTGADIYFDVITSGATINAMLAAVLASGTTVLRNAALDPEVVDTANLLNMMGASIRGAGTNTIRIEGVSELRGCTYSVIPDRLIAGAFLMAAGATKGCITVEGIIPEHLHSCLLKLKEIGMQFETREQSITAYGDVPLRATRVRTAMYPGFATDLQQPLTSVLLHAAGKSIITDKVYPKRFNHVYQLTRMGASIEVRAGSAFIQGQKPLHGTIVHASDVRAGVCLILAGLTAEGTTTITGVDHIERGYDNVIETFRSLGARMDLFDGLPADHQLLPPVKRI
jgi:UDP-N-acetylglucosamine 1-carboxyvinyltransferase